MDLFLEVGISNAVAALALAIVAFAVSRVCRRPAMVHGLWLLVLLKLVTPPVYRIPIVTLPAAAESVEVAAISTPPAAAEEQTTAVTAQPAATLPALDIEEDASNDTSYSEAAANSAGASEYLSPGHPSASEPTATVSEPQKEEISHTSTAIPSTAWLAGNWQVLTCGIWIAGAAAWLLLVALRVSRFQRLLRVAQPAPEELCERAKGVARRLGLPKCPEILLIPGAVSPMLWGLTGRARLLLPAELLKRLTERQSAALLAHELAHYRRGDHWIRWLEIVATSLYWWHPVIWWAKKELREAEEQCCDAWVVWALPSAARNYALALVETVDFLSEARSALPVGASGLGRVSDLKRRVTMIMKGNTPRSLTSAGMFGLLCVAVALLPWLPSYAQDRPRPPQPPAQPPIEEHRERSDREAPNPERQRQIEETRQVMQKIAEQMRHLQDEMEKAQRRLAELEGRPMESRDGAGRFGLGGSEARSQEKSREERIASMKRTIAQFDKNGDGKLQLDEIPPFWRSVRERFAEFDKNKDGGLDAEELEAAFDTFRRNWGAGADNDPRPRGDGERTGRGGAGGAGGPGGAPGFPGQSGQPGRPGGATPPGFSGGPGGSAPPGGLPGGSGPGGPGMPPGGFGPSGPGMPDANFARRLEELERKMDRLMQMMERQHQPQPNEPGRGRPRVDRDGETPRPPEVGRFPRPPADNEVPPPAAPGRPPTPRAGEKPEAPPPPANERIPRDTNPATPTPRERQ